MKFENTTVDLPKIVEKINNAISDIDYASSYSRSSASSSYCSYAKSSLRDVINELISIATNPNNANDIVKNNIAKIDNAISDISYASSYSRSSASSSYCSYAKSNLRSVREELNSLLSKLDKDKSQSNEDNLEMEI
jgi:hypothetical protein